MKLDRGPASPRNIYVNTSLFAPGNIRLTAEDSDDNVKIHFSLTQKETEDLIIMLMYYKQEAKVSEVW